MNEVGLSVSFADRSFMADYDIQALHQLFRDELPHVERVLPAPGPEILPVNGRPPLNLEAPLSRWWLKSADERFVLQLQENFFSFNWRRVAPRGEQSDYPGYAHMKERFDRYLKKVFEWHVKQGTTCPAPIAAELMYDDLLETQQDGKPVHLSSFLTFWSTTSNLPVAGWNVAWIEGFRSNPGPSDPVMKFTAALAGFAEDSDPEHFLPVLRLSFTAMGMLTDMTGIDTFFEDAHFHIGMRFNSIITEQAREAWGQGK